MPGLPALPHLLPPPIPYLLPTPTAAHRRALLLPAPACRLPPTTGVAHVLHGRRATFFSRRRHSPARPAIGALLCSSGRRRIPPSPQLRPTSCSPPTTRHATEPPVLLLAAGARPSLRRATPGPSVATPPRFPTPADLPALHRGPTQKQFHQDQAWPHLDSQASAGYQLLAPWMSAARITAASGSPPPMSSLTGILRPRAKAQPPLRDSQGHGSSSSQSCSPLNSNSCYNKKCTLRFSEVQCTQK
jgi:hypothetical protein